MEVLSPSPSHTAHHLVRYRLCRLPRHQKIHFWWRGLSRCSPSQTLVVNSEYSDSEFRRGRTHRHLPRDEHLIGPSICGPRPRLFMDAAGPDRRDGCHRGVPQTRPWKDPPFSNGGSLDPGPPTVRRFHTCENPRSGKCLRCSHQSLGPPDSGEAYVGPEPEIRGRPPRFGSNYRSLMPLCSLWCCCSRIPPLTKEECQKGKDKGNC